MFMNGYSYANANPVNIIDPTGLYGESPDQFANTCNQDGCADVSGVKNEFGITLSGCWNEERVADVSVALTLLRSRIVPANFGTAFGTPEIRLVSNDSQVDYGRTSSGGRLIRFDTDAINSPRTEGDCPASASSQFRQVIVHEFGHVLLNRTNNIASGMRDTALTEGGTLILPNRFSAASMCAVGGVTGTDPVNETVADYFMFWAFNSFWSNINGTVGKAYTEGGMVVLDRSGPQNVYPVINVGFDPPSDPFSLQLITRALSDPNDLLDVMFSPGMNYWLNSAQS